MTTPVRMKLSRQRGFRLKAHSASLNGLPAISVTRPGVWGNPFPAIKDAADAVNRFNRWLDGNMPPLEMSQQSRVDRWADRDPPVSLVTVRGWMVDALPLLRGKNLACWCALDAPCHADVLLEMANRPVCESV